MGQRTQERLWEYFKQHDGTEWTTLFSPGIVEWQTNTEKRKGKKAEQAES